MQILNKRPRRNRSSGWVRELVQQNRLDISDLIYPIFVCDGESQKEEIGSLPDVYRCSVDLAVEQAKICQDLGIPAIALFPCVAEDKKNHEGSEALNPDNLMCRAIKAIKNETKNLGVITDVALDPYTTHGHDGILKDGKVLNDETVEILSQQAVVQAQAGADLIAPSDMMDGRVAKIRQALEMNNFKDVKIMSYAVKYASSFYGPFRDAVGSNNILTGDKKTYQMNPANLNEALIEAELDVQEGADMIIIKPGLPYLDVIKTVSEKVQVPIFAYHVSGEYAMLKAASQKGWLNYEDSLMESLIAFKRAGCSGVLTYGAVDAARILSDN